MNKRFIFLLLFLFFMTNVYATTINNIKSPVPIDTNRLVFTFSSKVLPKKLLYKFTNEPLLSCSDNLTGTFEVISQNTLYFYPDNPLIAGKKIICEVNSDKFLNTKWDNKKVKFYTEPFKINDLRASNYNNKISIFISFNDKTYPTEIYKKFSLNYQKQYIGFKIFPEQGVSDKFILTPISNKKFPELTLNIKDYIYSKSGAKLNKKFKKHLKFNANKSVILPKKPLMNNFKAQFIAGFDGSIRLRIYMNDVEYWEKVVNKNPLDFISVSPNVKFSLNNEEYLYFYGRDRDEKYIELIGDFKPLTTYKIYLKKGLETNKFVLKKDKVLKVVTGHRLPSILFEDKKEFVSNKGNAIKIKTTNLSSVKVTVEKLLPQNFRYFAVYENRKSQNFSKYSTLIYQKNKKMNHAQDKIAEDYIDLSEVFKKNNNGIFRLKLYATYKYKNIYGRTVTKVLNPSKLIYLSDIGITAKVSNNQIFVSLQSLSDANSIANARLTVYSNKNTLIAKGVTNKNGIWQFDLKKQKNRPKVIVAEYINDKNVLVFDKKLNKANPYPNLKLNDNYKALLYMPRKLLRPGDKENLLIVVKDNNFKSINNFPLKLVVTDSVRTKVIEKVIKLNSNGVSNIKIDIPVFYKTGNYRAKVLMANKVIGVTEFKVEDFMPQQLENTIKLNKETYFLSEPIKVQLTSRYMFGAVPSNLKAEIHYRAASKTYTNKKYKNFSFTYDVESQKREFEFQRQTKYVKLDKKGQAQVLFTNNKSLAPPSILQGMITGIVFDDGRPVSEYKKFDIYPYKHLVGILRHHSGFVEPGNNEKFTTVLIDPLTSKTFESPLQITLYKKIWYQIYDSKSAWGYRWEQELQKVREFQTTSGKTFNLKTNDTGEFVVVASDLLGKHKAAVSFYVGGWNYDIVSPREDMRKLDILIKNKDIRKGDLLSFQIKSPIAGRLLVTLESDKVYKYKVLKITKNTALIKMPIDFDVKRGVYVSALIIRDNVVKDSLLPFRAFGSEFIKANLSNKKINIEIKNQKIVEPGKVNIVIKTNASKGSSAVVSIVDYGILNIIKQKPVEAFKYFYRIPILQMALFDFYDNLANYYKITPKMQGAGNVSMAIKSRMKKFLGSDSINERVKPLSIYSGLLSIDDKGEAVFKADIPSFNGKTRIESIVVGKNNIDSTKSDMIIREPVIIKPVYPRFLIEGDNVEVPLRLFNNLKSDVDVRFTISATKEVRVSSLTDTAKIKASEQIKIPLTLEAIKQGNAKITINLFVKDKVFTNTVSIPVRTQKILVNEVFSGETDKEVVLNVPNDFLSGKFIKADINLDSTYISQFSDIFYDLVDYPYGCLEQTVSRLFAMLYMDKFIDSNNEKYASLFSQRKFYIQDGIRKLQSMQRYDGSFLYWPNGNTINEFASMYATDFLVSARLSGFKVPNEMYNSAIDDLKRGLNFKELPPDLKSHDEERYNSEFLRLYSAYILSKVNKLKRSSVNSFYDKGIYKDNLPATMMMGYVLNKLGLRETAIKVKKYAEQNYNKILTDRMNLGGDFYSYNRDLAFALKIYLETFGKTDTAFKWLQTLAYNKSKRKYYSTQETAFIVRALAEYYKKQKPTKLDATIVVNGKTEKISKRYSMVTDLKDKQIKIKPNNASKVNYSVSISGFRDISKLNNLNKSNKNLTVYRKFYANNGELADLKNLKVGDLLYIQTELSARNKIENVVVANLIPSCFEIVNKRLDQMPVSKWFKNSKNYDPDYVDIRDDRILTFLTVDKKVYFYQPVRVVSKGSCVMPAIQTEAMYYPSWQDFNLESGNVIVNESD